MISESPQLRIALRVKDAAIALGFADVSNLNSPTIPVDVCATVDTSIDEKMRRVSSYHAFLPAEVAHAREEHLKVCTNAMATRIDFDAGVAVGVVFESSQSTDEPVAWTFYARAKKEVVICCGAIGSPQLLLLRSVLDPLPYTSGLMIKISGIGRKEDLKEHGIETIVDLPGVGTHLVHILFILA